MKWIFKDDPRYVNKTVRQWSKSKTVNKTKSILSTVNKTVYDVVPEIGKKRTKHITFSKEVARKKSSPGTLMSIKDERDATPAEAKSGRKRITSPPPPHGRGRSHLADQQ